MFMSGPMIGMMPIALIRKSTPPGLAMTRVAIIVFAVVEHGQEMPAAVA